VNHWIRVGLSAASVFTLCVTLAAGPALAGTSPEPPQTPSPQMSAPPSQPPQAIAGTAALTLAQAVQTAQSQNPQIRAAQEAVVAAQYGVAAARAGFGPTISANGTGSAGTSSAVSSTSSGTAAPVPFGTSGSVSLVATLPLYDACRTPAAVESANAALAQADAALRQIRQDTALAVATAFFNVLSAERLTSVREAQLAQAQAQLALSEAQVRAGVAARADVLQAQSQVAQAQLNLLTARDQIATSKAGLQAAIGVDASSPVDVQEPPVPPLAVSLTAEAAMHAAEANRPEVVKAGAIVQSDQAALDLARINAGPQVTVSAGTAYTPLSSSPILNNATSYGLTTTIALPLYNTGAQAGVDQAQASLRGAQSQLQAAVLSVRQDAYQSYLAAVQDAETITAAQAAQAAAEAALQVSEGRYRAGVGTILEVVTARATAAQAEVNAVSALYTYQSALATLRHAQGISVVAGIGGETQ
jgi:outer membrane protein